MDALAATVWTQLQSMCPGIPDATYAIYYDENISPYTLAYTTTWFVPDEVWTPVIKDPTYIGYDFEIAVNPYIEWSNNCTSTTHDLYSTLLHEFLHGVGILSTVRADLSTAPGIYDQAMRDIHGAPVVNHTHFNSTFGERIFINNVELYNPPVYHPGSSLSHTLQQGVMDYSLHTTECHRHVNNDVLNILDALGYECDIMTTPTSNGIILPIPLGVGAAILLLVLILTSRFHI